MIRNRAILLILLLISIIIAALIIIEQRKEEKPAQEVGMKLSPGCLSRVEIIILVDNNPNPQRPDLKPIWGISMLVRAGNMSILFDTGPSPEALKHNCEALRVNLSELTFVVISHEHGDHVGGLPYVAKMKPGVTVYVPSKMSAYVKEWIKSLNLTLVDVERTSVVSKGVIIIGQLYGPPWEQALALNTTRGLVILVGCSHPGVENVVTKAMKELKTKPYLVIGGFHMSSRPREDCERTVKELLKLGVRLIAPIHCSGSTMRRIMEDKYDKYYLKAYIGTKIKVE